jgi:L-threonylcarbamoyladenylate synthase
VDVLDAGGPEAVERALAALGMGLVVALPTDTVYGLAVDPFRPGSVERLFALKQRPADVALPLLVASRPQVEAIAGTLGAAASWWADRYWPGPLTLVVPRTESFQVDLGGPSSSTWSVGVRWPDHSLVRELCLAVGPLAVTSANRHGNPPVTHASEVHRVFGDDRRLPVLLDGGECNGLPSTVIECRGTATRCLREGAIPWMPLVDDGPGGMGAAS